MRRVIGILIALTVALAIGYALLSSGPEVPDSSVLVLELSGELREAPPIDAISQLFTRGISLPTLVLQLDKAGSDERIAAVLLHIRPLSAGYAQIQELRQAVERAREKGKTVIALLDLATLNATRELYLASAADQVYVVPGYLGPFAGISGQFMFLGSFLEKLGIKVEYAAAGEYKSAPEMFAHSTMSEPARQNADALLDGLFNQILEGIGSGRDLDPSSVRGLIDTAPGTPVEYMSAALADGIADREHVLEQAGFGESPEVEVSTYLHVDPTDLGLRDGPTVALVFASGTVMPGEGSSRSRGFAAGRVADALEEAAEDPEVRAIVLRIDTGGGSALASDQLWLTIQRVRKRVPIVVSMGNAAASGGYYLASAADAIVAQPATLTGSIGVFMLRASVAGLYDKLDINTEIFERGPFSTLAASAVPFTEEQQARAQEFVHIKYDEFLDRVAAGREIDREEVDRLGRGQVWLGDAAFGHGLVDAMGGLHTAVERAALEAGVADEADPVRQVFPGPRSLGEQLREMMSSQIDLGLNLGFVPDELRALLESGLDLTDGEIAYLPFYWIEIK